MAPEPITTIEQLIARFENSMLDYKAIYDLAQKATRYEIAKDVAAFANAFGGTIVVGVRESGGKPVKLEGVSGLAKLTAETATALQQFCAPIPYGPEEHAITVRPNDAARLLQKGAALPSTDVTLVTLNVRADPRGPIGVRLFDAKTEQPVNDAYRFPVRIDDHTRFLGPWELPMWMNSHERRVAIQLREIPSGARVRAFQRHNAEYQTLNFQSVDEAQSIAIFSLAGAGPAHVPLSFVAAVWREPKDDMWSVKIDGTLYRSPQYTFEPQGV